MTRVKICGITRVDDARAAAAAGADFLGFIFYPPSPRYVTPEHAREIVLEIRKAECGMRMVGVFVDASLDAMREIMETAELDFAQLHGNESPETVQALGTRAYKALQARDAETARALMEKYRAVVGDVLYRSNLPAFIADAPPAQLPGGNGIIADWSVARAIAQEFPILLAGGLNVENVRGAIQMVQPYGVDVSSGVERAPGLKDHAKVKAFIHRVKG